MGAAYAVGLVLIYLLVVAQFSSYLTPLIIMAPIPLALVGVMPGRHLKRERPSSMAALARNVSGFKKGKRVRLAKMAHEAYLLAGLSSARTGLVGLDALPPRTVTRRPWEAGADALSCSPLPERSSRSPR